MATPIWQRLPDWAIPAGVVVAAIALLRPRSSAPPQPSEPAAASLGSGLAIDYSSLEPGYGGSWGPTAGPSAPPPASTPAVPVTPAIPSPIVGGTTPPPATNPGPSIPGFTLPPTARPPRAPRPGANAIGQTYEEGVAQLAAAGLRYQPGPFGQRIAISEANPNDPAQVQAIADNFYAGNTALARQGILGVQAEEAEKSQQSSTRVAYVQPIYRNPAAGDFTIVQPGYYVDAQGNPTP